MANVYRHFPTATSSERFKADHISESEVSKWIASYQKDVHEKQKPQG